MPGKRILIVEDSPELQSFLAEGLAQTGQYEILTADDGTEGLRLALQQRPDLIVADYLMPNQSGLEMLMALYETGQHTPAIMMTGAGSEQLAATALRLGICEYLIKPFTLQELVRAVSRALGNGRALLTVPSESPSLQRGAIIESLTYCLQNTDEAVMVVDAQQYILFYNRAAQTLFDLPACHPSAGHFPEDHPELLALFDQSNPAQLTWQREVSIAGGLQVFDAHVTVIPDLGYLAILHDISYLKQLNQTKNDFVLQVSQDIRSPLTSILSYAELLGTAGALTERQQTFIERIVFSVQAITTLLADLLDLNRIENDLQALREAVHLPLIVRYVVENMRREIEARQQRLDLHLPDKMPPVLGNPVQLRKMAQQLLGNSIKYTPQGGSLAISLTLEDGFLVLRFSDSGIGIPTDEQPRVFEQFYHARNAPGGQRGTGLGLSIVKSIVEAHGGLIWPESAGEGQGTTFVVILPAQQAAG